MEFLADGGNSRVHYECHELNEWGSHFDRIYRIFGMGKNSHSHHRPAKLKAWGAQKGSVVGGCKSGAGLCPA